MKKTLVCLICIILISSGFAGCSSDQAADYPDESREAGNGDVKEDIVKIVYVEWDSEIASSNVVKAVIEEKLGYNCELLPVSVISMWESVAAGGQDGMVAAWLPSLHENYYKTHQEQLENLGPNLKGARMGLVVPAYVPVDSIAELSDYAEEFGERIIGIDPDAGIMEKTEQVINEYSLHNFNIVPGSDATMTTTLENAINSEEWIIITGWTPHWKFARWDLKYLQDPLYVFGEDEYISTIVRQGLAGDMPAVYSFLDNFFWTAGDMEQVMLWTLEDGTTPGDAARRWVAENEDVVNKWLE